MRGLIIQQSPSKGGALTFTERLINYCKINKINTFLICNNNEKEHFSHLNINIIINTRITSIKINTHPIRIFFKIIEEIYSLSTIIRKVKPDVIFVSNIAQGTLLGTIFFRKPILFFFHTYPDQKYDWFTQLYIKIFSSFKCVYITVSKYSGIKVAKYLGLPIDSVKILYNYAYKGSQINISHERKFIKLLTIGHVTDIKNPELWLEIAIKIIESNNNNINFYWAGDGDLLNLMREKVKKRNYTNRIFFLGHQDDVQSLYQNSDIYFQPSKIESHGIAVVEAMYNRLPVIVSNSGGLPESVDHLQNGMIHDINDIHGFLKSIIWLADSPKIRKIFGESGRNKCEKYFSESIWNKNLSFILNSVLDLQNNEKFTNVKINL